MIKMVSQLNILTNTEHLPYNSPKGKIEQLLKIGAKATGRSPKGDLPGDYPQIGLH